MLCKSKVQWFIVLSCSAAFSLSVWSDAVSLINVDSGWYRGSDGDHSAANKNYLANVRHNNFFVFDLGGVEEVSSASLRIFTHNSGMTGRYQLHHVDTGVSVLRSTQDGRFDIYNDLADGAVFGSKWIFAADAYSYVEITLNEAAVADLNKAGGLWAVGGHTTGSAFGGSHLGIGNRGNRLILETIPEPASAAMLLLIYPLVVLRRHFSVGNTCSESGRIYGFLNKLCRYFFLNPAYKSAAQDRWM